MIMDSNLFAEKSIEEDFSGSLWITSFSKKCDMAGLLSQVLAETFPYWRSNLRKYLLPIANGATNVIMFGRNFDLVFAADLMATVYAKIQL
jgi:hypothetical protein